MVDFQKEVINRSFQLPIVVDFWAPWCGPCRVLTPIIEQIAQEQEGKWVLVKLNTEEQPDISDTYQIRSIPNVKLFYRGEVIQEFSGAFPRQKVLDWLLKALPHEGIVALDQLLTEHSTPTTPQLENLLERYPESEEIRIVLAQLVIWDNPNRAAQVLEPFKLSSPFIDKVHSLRDVISFLQYAPEDTVLDNIQQMLFASKIEEAIPVILEVLAKDDKAGEGKLAKGTIGLFNLLGTHHPLTRQYRKQLDMYLWK